MRFRLALATILSLLALPLAAQSTEVGVWHSRSNLGTTTDQDARIEFNDMSGFAFSVNHFWTRHVSTEVAYSSSEGDGTLSFAGQPLLNIGDLKLKTLTATAQWHVSPKSMFDPYAGGGLFSAGAGDLASDELAAAGIDRIRIEDGSGWVANGGVNVNVTRRLGVGVDVKYFRYHPRAAAEGSEPVRLDLNPLVISAGARLRF